MQNKIQYSPLSLRDLDEVWDYIALVLQNPTAADNTVNGIMDRVADLKDFSETGAKLYFENSLDSGYRYMLYNNYIAYYHASENTVFVDHVVYSRRDYMRILFPEK